MIGRERVVAVHQCPDSYQYVLAVQCIQGLVRNLGASLTVRLCFLLLLYKEIHILTHSGKSYAENFKWCFKTLCLLSNQTAWIQIRPDILLGLIWIQTVYKDYQQMTNSSLAGKELRLDIFMGEISEFQEIQIYCNTYSMPAKYYHF